MSTNGGPEGGILMCSCQGIDHGRDCGYFPFQEATNGLRRDQEAAVVESRPQVRLDQQAANGVEANRIAKAQEQLAEDVRVRQRFGMEGTNWTPHLKTPNYPLDFHPKQKEFMDAKQVGALAGMLLSPLRARRRTLIDYLKDKVAVSDWHAVSDAANDLRELDVEIRMTEKP